jgi:hypothetical protein
VLWPAELIRQVGKLPVSHRYNHLPLLPSDPGGVQQELVVQDLPDTKVVKNQDVTKYKQISMRYFKKILFK